MHKKHPARYVVAVRGTGSQRTAAKRVPIRNGREEPMAESSVSQLLWGRTRERSQPLRLWPVPPPAGAAVAVWCAAVDTDEVPVKQVDSLKFSRRWGGERQNMSGSGQ